MGIIDDFDRARFPAFYMNRRPDMFGLPPEWNQSEEGKAILKNLHDKVLTGAIPKFVEHITDKLEHNGGTWLASTDGPTLADCLAVPFLRSFTIRMIVSRGGREVRGVGVLGAFGFAETVPASLDSRSSRPFARS